MTYGDDICPDCHDAADQALDKNMPVIITETGRVVIIPDVLLVELHANRLTFPVGELLVRDAGRSVRVIRLPDSR